MQTFQSLLAERWLGSLKPMVLSNCSYLGETETGCYRHILPQVNMPGPCQDPQVPLAGAVTMQKTLKNLLQIHGRMVHAQHHAQQSDGMPPTPLAKHFPQP